MTSAWARFLIVRVNTRPGKPSSSYSACCRPSSFIGDAEATINWSVTVCKTIYPRTFGLSHLTAWRVAPRWKAKWRVYSRTLGFTVGWSSFWLRTLSLIFNRAGICGVLGEHSFRIRHVRYYVVYLHFLTSFSYDHTVVSRMKTMFSYLKFVD